MTLVFQWYVFINEHYLVLIMVSHELCTLKLVLAVGWGQLDPRPHHLFIPSNSKYFIWIWNFGNPFLFSILLLSKKQLIEIVKTWQPFHFRKTLTVLLQICTDLQNLTKTWFSMKKNLRKFNKVQGVPKNMGIQWRIRYRLCYELAL